MSQKKNYSRSFIILQENEKGHGISSDKLPTGYAKIETRNGKCKVFFYVQNLKSTSKPYYMILVCNKKDTKKLIRLGELKLDEYGKAEVSKEYDENDVGESGIAIDRVIGAAISQFNGSDMLALMSGFNATDIPEDWKTYSLAGGKSKETLNPSAKPVQAKPVQTKAADTKKVPEIKVQEARNVETKPEARKVKTKKEEIKEPSVKPLEVKTDEVTVKVSNKEKVEEKLTDVDVKRETGKKESDNIFDKYEESIESTKKASLEEDKNISINKVNDENRKETNKEEEKLEVDKVKKEENKCPCYSHDEQKVEPVVQNEVPTNNRNQDYPVGKTGEFFKNLASEFEDLGEIFEDVRYCRWYKVPSDFRKHRNSKEEHNKYTLLYYPMMSYYSYIQRNGYYLVGYKCDKVGKMKYIVYGILGTKNKFDQPFGGRTGFVSWVPMERGKEGYDDEGCWLMFYDFKNAAILVPQR